MYYSSTGFTFYGVIKFMSTECSLSLWCKAMIWTAILRITIMICELIPSPGKFKETIMNIDCNGLFTYVNFTMMYTPVCYFRHEDTTATWYRVIQWCTVTDLLKIHNSGTIILCIVCPLKKSSHFPASGRNCVTCHQTLTEISDKIINPLRPKLF